MRMVFRTKLDLMAFMWQRQKGAKKGELAAKDGRREQMEKVFLGIRKMCFAFGRSKRGERRLKCSDMIRLKCYNNRSIIIFNHV